MSSQTNFDRVAKAYKWAEYIALGPLLQRTRRHWLPHLAHIHNALVLGDGDGRFLLELFTQNRAIKAVAVDSSAAMLHELERRCTAFAPRLRRVHASALTAQIPTATNLIVTHFFLDCLTQAEVDALAKRLAARTKPGTLWLVSDFAIPSTPLLRHLAAIYIRALYFAFRILTGLRVRSLPNIHRALVDAGYAPIARHEKLFGMLYTELWQRK